MRREGWWALLILGIGGLAAADHVFASFWDFPTAAGELPDAVRAYRAAGLPWTAADVAPPPVPAAENAAPLLKKAIAALPPEKESNRIEDRAVHGESIGDLGEFSRALRFAHEAAARPRLDFRRNWGLGPTLTFPENRAEGHLCRMLGLRAELRARAGDDAGALSDLDDAYRLASRVGSEPAMISVLGGARCRNFALKSAQGCLVAVHADLRRLARYRSWLAQSPSPFDLVRAIRYEAFATVSYARNFDGAGVGEGFFPDGDIEPEDCSSCLRPNAPFRREGLPQNVRSRAYMARGLQLWTELARETHGLSGTAEEIERVAQTVYDRAERARGMSYRLDGNLLPVYSQFALTNKASQARQAVALAFADALILHARTGRWPTTLAVPDPLGTGPLKVRFDGKRFRVWSVGMNGKDEDGLLPQEQEQGLGSDDVVAAYPPVPPRPREPSPPNSPPGFD